MLEVGPGLGVLTEYLAERVARVHAVELDRGLEPHLAERLRGRENVDLTFGDALRLDLAALEPAPTKFVANLPYNVATPLIVESLDGLPSVSHWTVMVQREVADRLFARPSTKAYGAVSVLVQLATERTGFHPVSRTVFRPPPNVDSALVAFRRIPLPEDFAAIKNVVEAAFAHRRKTLPNSIELAGLASARAGRRGAGRNRPRPRCPGRSARAARVRRAHRRDAMKSLDAPAKINLALVVGPVRPDGKHEVATVLQWVDLADRISLGRGSTLAIDGFPEDTLVRNALLALAKAAAVEPNWSVRIEKRIPVAAGLGGGSSDAAAALRLANDSLSSPLRCRTSARSCRGTGRRRPVLPDRRHAARHR